MQLFLQGVGRGQDSHAALQWGGGGREGRVGEEERILLLKNGRVSAVGAPPGDVRHNLYFSFESAPKKTNHQV